MKKNVKLGTIYDVFSKQEYLHEEIGQLGNQIYSTRNTK